MSIATSVAAYLGTTRADVTWLANGAKKVYKEWGAYFDRLHGDVPVPLICVRVWHETGGNYKAVSSIGETGLLQVQYELQEECGIGKNPTEPGANVWCGMMDWNRRSKSLKNKFSNLFPSPNAQFWGCSNLTMSLGGGGTAALIKGAGVRSGNELNDLVAFVKTSAFENKAWGTSLGRGVSLALVAQRVAAAGQWVQAAQQLGSLSSSGYGKSPDKTDVVVGGSTTTASLSTIAIPALLGLLLAWKFFR